MKKHLKQLAFVALVSGSLSCGAALAADAPQQDQSAQDNRAADVKHQEQKPSQDAQANAAGTDRSADVKKSEEKPAQQAQLQANPKGNEKAKMAQAKQGKMDQSQANAQANSDKEKVAMKDRDQRTQLDRDRAPLGSIESKDSKTQFNTVSPENQRVAKTPADSKRDLNASADKTESLANQSKPDATKTPQAKQEKADADQFNNISR